MTHVFWYLARSAGFLTYLCAWGSMVWGLLLSTRLAPRLDRAGLYLLHRLLSLGCLLFLVVHLFTLYLDPWANFSLRDLLVPFASDYRTFGMACGIVVAFLLLVVTVSSLVQARLPVVLWRGVHYLAFLAFAMGLLHGIITGADTRQWWAIGGYGLTAAVVAGLVVVRTVWGRQVAIAPAAPVRTIDPRAHALRDLAAAGRAKSTR